MPESSLRGTPTSGVELTNVSPHGLWLLLDEREVFLGFREFPWFANATISQLGRIERPSHHHLYWRDLDIDLAVESLQHPERYPLVSRVAAGTVRERVTRPAKPSRAAARKK
jgi:hypothetical protein